MSSPTSRSLQHAKKLGWHAQVVERWNQYARVRQDLFGCIDVLAIAGDKLIGIQATSGNNHASRVAKALKEPRLRAWLAAGALFEVWSWAKQGKAGKRKLWTLRREPLELSWRTTAMTPDVVSGQAADVN
jgi:hypothetical protein